MTSALDTVRREIDGVLDNVEDAAPTLAADLVLAAPRVFAAGEGRSGLMAKAFAMRLMHLGLRVHVVGETVTPGFGEADLLVAVSGSGSTAATLRSAQQVRDKGGMVLAVTTDAASRLADLAERTVVVPAATKARSATEASTQQPLGSLFDQCTHVLLDAVCLEITRRRAVSLDESRGLHASE